MTAERNDDRAKMADWTFPAWIETRTILLLIALIFILFQTGRSLEIDRMVRLSAEAAGAALGSEKDSQVARGLSTIASSLFPLRIEQREDVRRIEDFNRDDLPAFSHLETTEIVVQRLNPETLQMESKTESVQELVHPYGYLLHVVSKLIETLEIALWGTLLAVLLSAPLALLSAANLTPNRVTYVLARGLVSGLRAIPELVSALFLVIAYGFGPAAGILALAFHGAGFLGKFYAEDIENADLGPQDALRAIGTNKINIFRYAILPNVLPQYIAYTLYVLDRNVRTATVIGIVGAGGIGQELKGRFDMFNYQHVGTILVAIFVMVFLIDQAGARLRRNCL